MDSLNAKYVVEFDMKEVENSLRKDVAEKVTPTQGTRALWIAKRWWRYRPKLPYTYFLDKLDSSEVSSISINRIILGCISLLPLRIFIYHIVISMYIIMYSLVLLVSREHMLFFWTAKIIYIKGSICIYIKYEMKIYLLNRKVLFVIESNQSNRLWSNYKLIGDYSWLKIQSYKIWLYKERT